MFVSKFAPNSFTSHGTTKPTEIKWKMFFWFYAVRFSPILKKRFFWFYAGGFSPIVEKVGRKYPAALQDQKHRITDNNTKTPPLPRKASLLENQLLPAVPERRRTSPRPEPGLFDSVRIYSELFGSARFGTRSIRLCSGLFGSMFLSLTWRSFFSGLGDEMPRRCLVY